MAVNFIAAATGTNTATLPAHQVGDVFVAFGFCDGNNAVSVPTSDGWAAAIYSLLNNNSGCAVSYLIADSTSEVSGTWTNATSLIVLQYRPTAGEAVTFGVTGGGSSLASLGMNYPAVTLQNTDGTSNLLFFVGHRSNDVAPLNVGPTGSTNRATVQDSVDRAAAFDMAGATSWAGETVTYTSGSSGGYKTAVVEMKIAAASGPSISSTSDDTPTDGTTLTVNGSNFGTQTGSAGVTLGGTAVTPSSWTATAIQIPIALGSRKYGTNYAIVVTDSSGVSSSGYNVQIQPASGKSYTNAVAPLATSGDRVTATPDIADTNQVEVSNVQGGTISDVTLNQDMSFSVTSGVTAFDIRVNDGTGWGSVATQYVAEPGSDATSKRGLVRALVRPLTIDIARDISA